MMVVPNLIGQGSKRAAKMQCVGRFLADGEMLSRRRTHQENMARLSDCPSFQARREIAASVLDRRERFDFIQYGLLLVFLDRWLFFPANRRTFELFNGGRGDGSGKSSVAPRQDMASWTSSITTAFIATAISMCGCAEKIHVEGDPKTIVYENVKAMEDEDLDRVMATIDDENENYEGTKNMARQLFKMYNLKYTLDSVQVMGETESEAKVRCLQTTTKLSGPAFRDNRIDIVHRLRKIDGYWKIYSSQVNHLEYLN